MVIEREVALELALVAVIGAAKERGVDDEQLVDDAIARLRVGTLQGRADGVEFDTAVRAIDTAHQEVLARASINDT